MEHEALQTYRRWNEEHSLKLEEVEHYWNIKIYFILALKKDAISSLIPIVKEEDSIQREVEASLEVIKKKKKK